MSDVEDKKLAESTPDEPTKAAEEPTETTTTAKDGSSEEPNKESAKAEEDASPANGDKTSTPVPKSNKSKATTVDGNKSASKAAGKSAEDDAGESYQAGDSVQVKIQGYPWWPAVVVTPEHFPAAALAARPPVKTRKDGTSAISYPVQFLGAPEYYWSRPTDIKPLSHDEIKAWVDSGKKSSTKGLKNAYQQALKTPSLDELMEAKVALEKSAEEEEDEDEEMADEEAEDDAAEDDEEEVELDDEGKPVKKSKAKKKSTAAARTPKKTPAKTPTKKRKTTTATEGEEDGETAPSAKKSRATPKSSKSKAAAAAAPSPPASPELTPEQQAEKTFESTKKSVMIIRSRIQKCLLGERCDEKILPEIPGCLDRLDRIEPDVRLGRETKIGKVLTRMHKLESIPRDAELGIKAHVKELVDKWNDVVQQIRRLDEEEGKTTAAAAKASTPAPAVPATSDETKTAPAAAAAASAAADETTDTTTTTTTTTNGHAEGAVNGDAATATTEGEKTEETKQA